MVKPFAIPREWLKFRAMDFGQARPYAVLWFAVDFDGNIFAYRELYGWGGKPNVGTGVTGPTIQEELNDVLIGKRLVAFEQSSKGRLEGVNAFKQRLIGNDKNKPELPDTDAEDHALDAICYACMSRPWTPIKRAPPPPRDAWSRSRKFPPSR